MALAMFRSPGIVVCSLTVYFLTLLPPLAVSQQKQQKKLNVAILDFDTRGAVTKDEAGSLSDWFQSYLVDTGEFTVLDRSRIKALMQELGFQQSGACSDVECVVEAGKMLKVEKMFAGNIGKVGKIYSVNVQLIDVATARVEMNRSKPHDGTIEGIAETVIPALVEEIASEMTGKQIKVARMSVGTSWLWYAGGAVLLGGGVAAYLLLKTNGTTPKTLPTPPALPQ